MLIKNILETGKNGEFRGGISVVERQEIFEEVPRIVWYVKSYYETPGNTAIVYEANGIVEDGILYTTVKEAEKSISDYLKTIANIVPVQSVKENLVMYYGFTDF